MKRKIFVICLLLICVLLSACGEREPDPNDRETFPPEIFQTVTDATLAHRGGLNTADYASDSAAGEWIVNCSSSDRDEQFDVYSLRHEVTAGEMTTFAYLIYYPHGEASVTADYEVLEGESGYVVNLRYTPGGSSNGYALSYLSVTLPTEKAPRLRILKDSGTLGQLASVSGEEITLP